ncbi:MAG: hypothetical protein JSU63_14910 [Phycisphaerales bacterium]|nr:MAG: hypothetical protein JSU63_14910 [Phycisphaerales bacterium]
MNEKTCNLWSEPADWRCIPTTGALLDDGAAVMASGVALEAAQRYHHIEYDLGRLIAARGNHVHELRPGVASFPIQQFAWSGPNLPTIERSARELMTLVGDAKTLLPRPITPGASLTWEEIAAALSFLPDNIVVIQHS